MIVECPNCQAKFRLPDEKVGPQGTKLRCGKCRFVFQVEPPEPSSMTGLSDFDFPDDMATPPETASAVRAAPAPEAAAGSASRKATGGGGDIPPEFFHSEAYEAPDRDEEGDETPANGPTRPGFSLDDVADIPLPGSRPSKERRRRQLIIGGAVLFVLVVTLVAIQLFDLWPGKKAAKTPAEPPTASAPAKPEAVAPESEKPAAPAEQAATAQKPEDAAKVKDVMLQNVRQYYVSNEKAGQLFVIEGKAVNNFKTPKEMIKLEASLFDEKGGSLATQEALAGNTVSLFQLQVMTPR